MAIDDRSDPLSDMFTLFAAPLAGTIRSVEQFRKGVDEFLAGVENFNRTMENLNDTSERINLLLQDVEEPIRAAIPQVTRTVKAADEVMQAVSGPALAVAPGLNRLANTLSNPAFEQLPNQIAQFSEILGEISTRLGPLTQLAGSAGGLLGGLRIPGTPAPRPPADPDPTPVVQITTTKRTVAKKATVKKPPAKKAAAKKSASRKTTEKSASEETTEKAEPKETKAKTKTIKAKRKPAKKAPASKRTAAKKSKS
jgi:hypothetical protein